MRRANELDLAGALALFEYPGKPGLVGIEELDHGLLHGFGECVVPRRKHPAKTHPAFAEDIGDAWVIGEEPVVVVDWYGASNYAKAAQLTA